MLLTYNLSVLSHQKTTRKVAPWSLVARPARTAIRKERRRRGIVVERHPQKDEAPSGAAYSVAALCERRGRRS